MKSIIEYGKFLSAAEKDRQVMECDKIIIVHHDGVPESEVMKQLNDIINNIPESGYNVLHALRYLNETTLLLKKIN